MFYPFGHRDEVLGCLRWKTVVMYVPGGSDTKQLWVVAPRTAVATENEDEYDGGIGPGLNVGPVAGAPPTRKFSEIMESRGLPFEW
jgi:hypothetical protein